MRPDTEVVVVVVVVVVSSYKIASAVKTPL